ncbi:MAG: hypothetical protein MZV70_31640 [Desulfobacterales bacterium]|nr:hypothetical protein [Desulfobacterales bacterium]
MIKMPINLVQRPNWMDALRDAIACLDQLQQKAEAERPTGNRLSASDHADPGGTQRRGS